MRGGGLRTGLGIAVSTSLGLSLALTANYLALAQPGRPGTARDPQPSLPIPLRGRTSRNHWPRRQHLTLSPAAKILGRTPAISSSL
jgi:hypothetical protein